jgi:protein involved in plasmid replication-relaxation
MTGTKRRSGRRRGLIIQPRDIELLRQLWIMRVADREQLKIAAGFTSITRINARLLALVRAGLLRRFFIGSGGGRKALYALSAKGAQMIEAPRRGPRRRQDELLVADFAVLHQLAINSVYCALRFGPISIRDTRFVNWMGFTEPITDNLSLIPDGYLEMRTVSEIDASFIEVDLGHEALAVWKEKAKHYIQLAVSGAFARRFTHPRFRVLVLANSMRRMQTIRAAVAGITEKIFWFATLDDVRAGKLFDAVWLRPVGETYQSLFEQPR